MKKTKQTTRLKKIIRLREVRLGIFQGIGEVRRIITELEGLQQVWGSAADALTEQINEQRR